MDKILAVIDTNVIVSSFLTKNPLSPTLKILEAVVDGMIVPVYCNEIIDEYREVLNRDKFKLPKNKSG